MSLADDDPPAGRMYVLVMVCEAVVIALLWVSQQFFT